MPRLKPTLIGGAVLIAALAAGAYFVIGNEPPAKTLTTDTQQTLRQLAATSAAGEDDFTLTSPAMADGGTLPADLKCERDGGDGLSPPISWTQGPDGTEGYAVIMHHYPRGRVEGVNPPSHYWLLWNIPATTQGLARGNPTSIGDEGSDKDIRRTGYTPPCSPPGSAHQYTITVYALSAPLESLPDQDNIDIDWEKMIAAMDGKVLASSALTFSN